MTSQRAKELHYPIRAVARMTGLSVDTLRAWERRYEAVVPGRSGRGRRYVEADIARLRSLAELVRRGHAIGMIAALPDSDLERLIQGSAPPSAPGTPAAVAPLEPLIEALDRYDLDALEAGISRYAVVLPPRELVFAVVVPLLREIGRRWQAGRLRPAQEHLASAVVRNVVGGLLRITARPGAAPRVAFATPSGERHELGLLCAALLTASAGHGVVYLGADLPADEIVHAAGRAAASVLVVSLTTPGAVGRRELKRLAADLPVGVALWVGGAEAASLLAEAGGRARHLDDLESLLPALASHAA
jgi:MerR family transcriptional regulator, light-induced transcriptional regulator